jgi:hypothetical protein
LLNYRFHNFGNSGCGLNYNSFDGLGRLLSGGGDHGHFFLDNNRSSFDSFGNLDSLHSHGFSGGGGGGGDLFSNFSDNFRLSRGGNDSLFYLFDNFDRLSCLLDTNDSGRLGGGNNFYYRVRLENK